MHPCELCTGECCKAYYVSLSGYDVWTIATGLALAPEQFVEIAQEHEATALGFKLDATKMTFAMLLGKRPGPDGRQQCVFLMNVGNDIGRCGIYALRPSACRVFPARLRDNTVTFRENVVCPKGSWNVAGIDLPKWRTLLLRSRMERAIYASVVHRWNEHAEQTPRGEMRTPNEYYGYLMEQYARLTALERETEPEAMEAVINRWGQRDDATHGEAAWERFLSRAEAIIASC